MPPFIRRKDRLPLCRESGIYVITNTANGKVYVGSAACIRARLRQHRSQLRKRVHCNDHLQHAWMKYGEPAFRFDVIETCEVRDLLAREQRWIDALEAAGKETGYNICLTAGSRLGMGHGEEAKAKMSAIKKALYAGKPGPRTGAVLSQETKDKMSVSMLGRKANDAARAKMSASGKGKKKSASHRANAAAAHWSKGPNAEAIAARIAAANVGKRKSEETRAKISATKLAANATTQPSGTQDCLFSATAPDNLQES